MTYPQPVTITMKDLQDAEGIMNAAYLPRIEASDRITAVEIQAKLNWEAKQSSKESFIASEIDRLHKEYNKGLKK